MSGYKPKIFSLLIVLTLITSTLQGAEKNLFSDMDLTAALNAAKTSGKPVMLFCYASWCEHCKYMREQVLTNPVLTDFYSKTFICVAQDMEKGDGPEMNKAIQIKSFPTFIFYFPDGQVFYRIEGEFKPDAFLAEGKNALNPTKQLPHLKKQFEKNVSNSESCYNYLRALKKGGMDYSEVVDSYFATQSDKQLLSEINWRIFSNGVSDFQSRVFQFVLKHRKEFEEVASPERVKRKLDYEVKALLSPLAELPDTLNYLNKRELAKQIHSYSADSLIFYYDLTYSELSRNTKMYIGTCLNSAEIYALNNPSKLNEIGYNFLKFSDEPKELSIALKWAQLSLSLNEAYDTCVLNARLHLKLGNKAEAFRMATKAKAMAKKYDWDSSEADKLLIEK